LSTVCRRILIGTLIVGAGFPPSTLLYISGLVDERAKVEIEVTAFVPAA
jgi:hypothetical protein